MLEEEASEKSNNVHDLPAARAWEGVWEEPLPWRLLSGRVGDES